MKILDLLDETVKRGITPVYDKKIIELYGVISDYIRSEKKDIDLNSMLKPFFKVGISGRLKECLENCSEDIFYYIGINKFVTDYYNENSNTDWKIKTILQLGFPFKFATREQKEGYTYVWNCCESIIAEKKWSLFIFTRKPVLKVTIGFDDRNTLANLDAIEWERDPDVGLSINELPEDYIGLFTFRDLYNEDHFELIEEYLKTEKIPLFTNAQYKELQYSFTEVPAEYFRLDYLDYLSRYKKSVVDLFGLPEKSEQIKKITNIIEVVSEFSESNTENDIEPTDEDVFIKNFYFCNGMLKPTVRVSKSNTEPSTNFDDFEIKTVSKNISPYYLYCLLSSEFVADFYADRFTSRDFFDFFTQLPIRDCVYIDMGQQKMCDKKYQEKYERDINPDTKVHDMIKIQNFINKKAKESIEKFLVEIKNDIDTGSYYSATIVMGSVLEAFLIDWLSELDGKNYFKEEYLVSDKRHNYQRRADLLDYIDIIQKRRPAWIDGAKKATEIRKKRNLVHAKLYIEKGEITQEICYELLRNLEIIINNRWPKK